jgi:hypothetical protein
MAANRQQTTLSLFALTHLGEGSCWLAEGCELCSPREADSTASTVLHLQAAREVWTEQRAELIARWTALLEQRDEQGLGQVPMFGQVLFDAVPLPAHDSAWPEALRDRYHRLASNVEELDAWFRAQG